MLLTMHRPSLRFSQVSKEKRSLFPAVPFVLSSTRDGQQKGLGHV